MNVLRSSRYGIMIIEERDAYIGRSIDQYGEFSEGEPSLWREFVRPGDTALDIGANIGSMTLPLAQMVGPTGLVHAFEPERHVFVMLCGNVAVNNLNHVRCHQKAVAESPGEIVVPEIAVEHSEVFGGLELEGDFGDVVSYKVPKVTVDGLGLDQCHFLKIDVEGMEQKVIAGASSTIAKHRPVLYVENDRPHNATAIKAMIAGLGYDLYAHLPNFYNPGNFRGLQQDIFNNLCSPSLLCVPTGRDVHDGVVERHGLKPIQPTDVIRLASYDV